MRNALAAAAAVALGAACPEPRHGASVPDGGAPLRAGIKVPLPPGWTARASADETLVAGPGQRVVLRLQQLPGGAGAQPEAEALLQGFKTRLGPGLEVKTVDSSRNERSTLLVLEIRPAADAGGRLPWLALLGATRVEEDLFLCATVPGATEDEVKAAAAACLALTRTAG